MSSRRHPIETSDTSTVVYPSALFSLERDEIFPYERFAHNVLSVAAEALHTKKLAQRVTVDFTQQGKLGTAWLINASISYTFDSSGVPTAFHFRSPELVPAILYMFTAVVVSEFFNGDRAAEFWEDPAALHQRIQLFFDGTNAGVRAYRDSGFGAGIRAAYDHLGLTTTLLQKCSDDYDLLAMQMAYHEVAHAYIGQVTRPSPTAVEKSAFEFIADLVATAWFYRKMVVNTPDSEQYRVFRGVNSHADAIFNNSLLTLRSQQSLLILMALAGAQRTGGIISLAAGPIHPPGMQRYLLQHVVLYTLIASNYGSVLSKAQFEDLHSDWDYKMETLVKARRFARG